MWTTLTNWSVEGTVGWVLLVAVAVIGYTYLAATQRGRRRDRRGRRWPRHRTGCFLAGLAILVVVLYSGIGAAADDRLSMHMAEHMAICMLVAPLLVAAAPVRLAFFALNSRGRRRFAVWLHSRIAASVTGPVGCALPFAVLFLTTQVPAVYGLALANDYVHEGEHGLYLLTAMVMWTPLIGADPLPSRPRARDRHTSMLVGMMLPMAVAAVWLATARSPVYGHYLGTPETSALHDQRLAAAIMGLAGAPALLFAACRCLRARMRRLLRRTSDQLAPEMMTATWSRPLRQEIR